MLRVLGAPPRTVTTTVSNGIVLNDAIRSWTPNWIIFDQCLNNVHCLQTACRYLNVALCIETIPVPPNVVARILAHDAGAVDEQSLLVAFKNTHLTRDVFLHLLDHIVQCQETDARLKLASTQLLHECAKSNCVEGAKAVIDYFPKSLDCTDVLGLRPLHGAFSYQNRSVQRSEMVSLLIKEGMKNCIGGEYGCGGIFLERSRGGSPFELSLYYLRQADWRGEDCEDQWKCLTACFEASKSTWKHFQPLNYVITSNIGMENMVQKIIERYSIDLDDVDDTGMTPLAVAIQHRKVRYIHTLLSIQNCALHGIPRCEVNGKCYKNRLPLHYAVDVGITWNDGLKEITESNEAALSMLDQTGLYPFMLAAQHKKNSWHDIYYLLRRNPSVLGHLPKSGNNHRYSSSGRHYAIHIFLGAILSSFLYHIFTTYSDFQTTTPQY